LLINRLITAGARRVDILANTAGEHPWIAVVDDGNDMSEQALVDAMRPRSRNPKEERLEDDLERWKVQR
jgi:hypothetical protein